MKKVLTNLKSKLKKVSKESLAIFAVIATTLGLMGYAIVNASDAPEHHKNVASNHDGTYKISLDVTGDANTEKPDAKANILVIYDVSGSMNNDESYTYAEKNTGRYGKVNNNVVDLYYVSGTNWQGNPQYSQVNSDTYTGDVYTRSGGYGYYTYTKYTGKRYWRVKRSQAAEKIVYDFAQALYRNNKTETATNVEMALLTFSSANNAGGNKDTATTLVQNWTNKEGTFLGKLSNTGNSTKLAYGGGTNWEAAMEKALDVLADADEDPTYVIFVTDGAPTRYVGDTSNTGGSTQSNDYERVYPYARDIYLYNTATSSVGTAKANTTLYGIFAFGNSTQDYLDDVMDYANTGTARTSVSGSTVPTNNYYNASETDDITAAIEDIFNAIAKTLGITDVSIADGTTSNVKASTGNTNYNLLNVDDTSFEYWLSMPVEGSNGNYTMTRKNLVTAEDYTINVTYNGDGALGEVVCTWDDGTKSVTLEGYVKNGILKYRWTGSNDLYKLPTDEATGNPIAVPAATYSKTTGAVDWDLAPVGTLLDGVTYTVTFDVWPSQYTYDLVSSIKNDLVDYETLDPKVKEYLLCDDSKNCELLTNTYANLTYTDTDIPEGQTPTETTIPFTDELDHAITEASNMTVKKLWKNEMPGDSHGEDEYSRITFKVIVDEDTENPYDEKVLLKSNNWTNSIYIAPGLIQTKNGTAIIREEGHDYTFNENPQELNYHWDLQVETVRPMVIDGVLTTLVKITENAPTIGDSNVLVDNGITYYKLPNKEGEGYSVYYVREQNEAIMQATNIRRSNLNLKKEVTGEAPEGSEFTFKLKVQDAEDANLWFSIRNGEGNVIKDDTIVTVENAEVFNKEYQNGEFVGFYEVSSNADITVKLQADWNLRFTNLPIGSTYSFEETAMPEDFIYDEFSGTTAVISTSLLPVGATDNGNGTYTYNGVVYTKVTASDDSVYYTYEANATVTNTNVAAKVSGTIYTGNTTYEVKYTNEYELTNVTVNKVWDDEDNQDGKRPTDGITLHLYQNGTELSDKKVTINKNSQGVTESEDGNTWTYTFSDLPKFDNNKKEYEYTVIEDAVTDYEGTTYSDNSVAINVVAKPNSDTDTITVNILANGEVAGTVTLNKDNDFSAKVTDLDYLDSNKKMITYTYSTESTARIKLYSADKTLEITNKHTPETVNINGIKVWNDNGNTNIKPTRIIIKLTGKVTGNNDPVYTGMQEVTNDKWSFDNLDRYYEGKEINYTVDEISIPGYTTSVSYGTFALDDTTGVYTRTDTVTNTLQEVSIPVTKVWADNSNQDGKRPTSITIRLYADNVEVTGKAVELSVNNPDVVVSEDGNSWTYTYLHLNKTDNTGKEITYTVKEDTVKNTDDKEYTKTEVCQNNVCTITNTLAPETVSVSGKKTWVDNGNTSIKPSSIEITLTGKVAGNDTPVSTQTISVSNDKWTFNNLPKYNNGKEITYTISEKAIPGYDTVVSGYNVTNTLQEVSIPVTKVWADNSNQDGKRPASITVRLFANDVEVTGKAVTLSVDNPDVVVSEDGNSWTYTYLHLNKTDNTGKEITYTVKEDTVKNTDNKEYTKTEVCQNNVCTITNTLAPETVSVSGKKTWVDNGNTAIKPSSIEITLTGKVAGNDTPVSTQTISVSNDEWTFNNLPKYNNGKEITYTISETPIPGYDTVVSGYNVTNTLQEVSIPVTKVWSDNSNQDGKRPTSITVRLFANDVEVPGKDVTLSVNNPDVVVSEDGNSWTYTYLHLNKTDNTGEDITYTVKEDPITSDDTEASYTTSLSSSVDPTTGVETHIITNRHDPKLINIPVTKVWSDNSNQDGKRPANGITIRIYANGTELTDRAITLKATDDVVTVTNNGNTWSYTFTNLPKYSNGSLITYTISEDSVTDYSTVIDPETNTITNSYTPEVKNITTTKTWIDGNNQDGIRPDKIIVRLLADGTEIDHAEALKADNYSVSFTGLPRYKNGIEINYTITEDRVPGYTTSISNYNITNTHEPEITRVDVVKKWTDNNDQDGKRPESITVNLLANKEVIDSAVISKAEDGSWSASFTDLPKYSGGEEIAYTVTEEAVEEYSAIPSQNGTTHYIENKYTPETVDIPVVKTWNDNNDQDGVRPDSIVIRIYADDVELKNLAATLTEKNQNDDGTWSYVFEDLPKYRDQGTAIVYTISEDEVDDYDTVVSGYNVTNTYSPEITSVSGSKTWNDADDQDGKRPESITIRLYADDVEVDSTTASAASDWSYSFPGLPKYKDHGIKINYTITEDEVPGYGTVITNYNISNTHTPEKTVVAGKKVWSDSNNLEGYRPDEITIRLKANDELVEGKVVTLTENDANKDGEWIYSFTDLPKYSGGKEIVYTVVEDEVENYTTSYVNDDEGHPYIVINERVPSNLEITVNKVWDEESEDGITDEYGHTDSIEVKLEGKVGETVYYEDTVTLMKEKPVVEETLSEEENSDEETEEPKIGENWTYTFTNLPEYREATKITYTVTELTEVSEYDTVITSDSKTNTYTITNKYNPGNATVSGEKIWDDEDNQDGKRPEFITINLFADGEKIDSIEVRPNEDGEWVYTFDNLPKVHNKKDIVYTITEEVVPGYESAVTGYNVTNTHTPETVSFKINKIWSDGENNDGKRPDSITVRLLANDVEVASTQVTENEDGEWTYNFVNYPKYADGELITYKIVEDPVANYSTEVVKVETEVENYNEYTITNTHELETTDIEITKTWDDYDNVAKLRPTEITVDLIVSEEVIDTFTITEEDGWVKKLTNLPKYSNGELIVYEIYEHEIFEYETTIVKTETGFNIINHHELGKGGSEEEPPQTGIGYTDKNNSFIMYIILILISIFGINIEFLKNN